MRPSQIANITKFLIIISQSGKYQSHEQVEYLLTEPFFGHIFSSSRARNFVKSTGKAVEYLEVKPFLGRI